MVGDGSVALANIEKLSTSDEMGRTVAEWVSRPNVSKPFESPVSCIHSRRWSRREDTPHRTHHGSDMCRRNVGEAREAGTELRGLPESARF